MSKDINLITDFTTLWDGYISQAKKLLEEIKEVDQKISTIQKDALIKNMIEDIDQKIQAFYETIKATNITKLNYGKLNELKSLLEKNQGNRFLDRKVRLNLLGSIIKKIAALQLEQKVIDYTAAIEQDKSSALNYFERGTLYFNQERYAKSIDDMTKALTLTQQNKSPPITACLVNRSASYVNLNNNKLAIADCSQVIEIDPLNATAYFNRSISFLRMSEWEKALKDLNKSIELGFKNRNSYYLRAYTFLQLKNNEESINDAIKAIELDANFEDTNAIRKTLFQAFPILRHHRVAKEIENTQDFRNHGLTDAFMETIVSVLLAVNKEGFNINLCNNPKFTSQGLGRLIPLAVMNPFMTQIQFDKDILSVENQQTLQTILNQNSTWLKEGKKSNFFGKERSQLILTHINTCQVQGFLKCVVDRLNGQQLAGYLNNFMTYLNSIRMDNTERQRIINAMVSLLPPQKLYVAATYFSNDLDPSKVHDHFRMSLKIASFMDDSAPELVEEKRQISSNKLKEKWGEFLEMLKEEQYFFIADEIISSECPTSLGEAQSVYQSTWSKYALAAALIPALGPSALALPIVLSTTRKIYLRWIRNTPVGVPSLIDYSHPSVHKFSKTFVGREEVFTRILQIWNQRKHPILVGPPGVGKTAIIVELARRIAAKQLLGFEATGLFAGSAAKFSVGNGMGPPLLPRIITMLKRYKVVLALDEIHALAQTKEKGLLQLLRSMTDDSPESLRYCIFATTEKEYEEYIERDESLSRRFTKIDIKPLEKNDILYLLDQEAKVISPNFSITEKALQYIYDQAKGDQNGSRKLLHHVIIAAEAKNAIHPSFEKLHKQNSEFRLLLSQHTKLTMNPKKEMELANEIIRIKQDLDKLKIECKTQEEIREKYQGWKDQLDQTKYARIRDAKKMSSLLEDNSKDDSFEPLLGKNEKELKSLLFTQYFDIPSQIERIKKLETAHGLISEIDVQFVAETLSSSQRSKL